MPLFRTQALAQPEIGSQGQERFSYGTILTAVLERVGLARDVQAAAPEAHSA